MPWCQCASLCSLISYFQGKKNTYFNTFQDTMHTRNFEVSFRHENNILEFRLQAFSEVGHTPHTFNCLVLSMSRLRNNKYLPIFYQL